MIYKAHIRDDGTYQTVKQHCHNSASYASKQAGTGLWHSAFLAGLLHDMGKYTTVFCEYIEKSAHKESVQRGSVNHTFAGGRFILERWHKSDSSPESNIACEIIAIASGAHHGLFDCINEDCKNGLLHRLSFDDTLYNEAKENFLNECASLEELDKLFEQAKAEIVTTVFECVEHIKIGGDANELNFCLAMLTRLLLSAVIEGDRRDTAEFMHNTKLPLKDISSTEWQTCSSNFEKKLASFNNSDNEINKIRSEISDRCLLASELNNGIYRLSVPTGGGKTLSSLRYALSAAVKHNKKRIFFVIPLLSVLEQNAKVIRDFLGDDTLVLEHHSNIFQSNSDVDKLSLDEHFMETWDKPFVITTLVQFLNTLFDGKTSCIRRMHALDNSIIILDEIQSIPKKLLSLFNMAINFLASACNATVILCSATQPCLEELPHPIYFKENTGLIKVENDWLAAFTRTKLVNKCTDTGYTFDEIRDFIIERMQVESSLLMICNTKNEAREIYNRVKSTVDIKVFHLSTSMCMAHRIETLNNINMCLDKQIPIICISTQLVEAGVDFSFGCVIRAFAGMDNIIQAAGRCNRNGEYGYTCPVYIINIRNEHLGQLEDIKIAQIASKSTFSIFNTQDKLDSDIGFLQSVQKYYTCLYNEYKQGAFDYTIEKMDTSIFSMLSDNRRFKLCCESRGKFVMEQAFATAGSVFKVFEDNTTDILVPYGDDKEIIAELSSNKIKYDYRYQLDLLNKAKQFSISIYSHELEKLRESNGLYSLCDKSILVLQQDFYSEEIGFDANQEENIFLEV